MAAGLAGLSCGGVVIAAKWKFNGEAEEALIVSEGVCPLHKYPDAIMQICSLYKD